MPRQPRGPQTQGDIVKEVTGYDPKVATVVVKEKLNIPELDILHTKPTTEVGAIFANIVKARAHLISFTYKVGEYIEVEYLNPSH